jgi:hypothetical protein
MTSGSGLSGALLVVGRPPAGAHSLRLGFPMGAAPRHPQPGCALRRPSSSCPEGTWFRAWLGLRHRGSVVVGVSGAVDLTLEFRTGLAGLDEVGGGDFSCLTRGRRQDGGVDVGGDADVGMSELVLNGLDVRARGVRERRDAVSQVVQADGGKSGAVDQERRR